MSQSQKSSPAPLLRFGTFEVDPGSHEIRKHGLRISLEGKPFQILMTLLENPGSVVTRKMLRQRLWPDSFVGYEHSLNTAVNKLRETLGDSPATPRFVETLPRLGYRFIAAVEKLGRAQASGAKVMLAVLPLDNLSGDPQQNYFIEGLTEELISHLGQLNPKQLGVIARTSSQLYKNRAKNVQEIGDELSVGYIMEGSVRLEKKRVRITLQLIQTSDQTHVWAASYDHDLREILNIQKDVAAEVAKALALELFSSKSPKPVAANPEAHEAYLQGRFFCGQRSEDALNKAMNFFEQALLLDPNCARACSGIADCCTLLTWFGALWPREAGSRAEKAAARALEIDPMLGEAYASLGLVRFWHGWDWKGAEEMFLRAIELNPSYAMARQWYASFLNSRGRLDEAQNQMLRAREIDPHAMIIQMNMADAPFFARQYDKAAEILTALLANVPQFFPALFNLGRAYVQMKKYPEAIEAFEKALKLSGNREGQTALAHAFALAGKPAKAHAILDSLLSDNSGRYLASPMIARIYLGLGNIDQTIEWLRKGHQERSYWMAFLKGDPVWDPIRGDHRFRELEKLV
jgi:TolB-like protein